MRIVGARFFLSLLAGKLDQFEQGLPQQQWTKKLPDILFKIT